MRRPSPSLLAALLVLAAGCGEPRRSVLLVTIDTLRQDHLGSYGGDLETPVLDRLAAEGFRFADAYTTAPTTLPAHTSLLTGTYPNRHGVRRNGLHRVPGEARTLAEVLGARGWSTAAFVGTAVLDAHYGLDQGFEVYDDAIEESDSAVQEQRRAERVVDGACAWLAGVRDPFFLWVHVFDPHGPYDPPPPFDGMYYEGDPRDPAHRSLEGVPLAFYQELEGVTDLAWPLAQYRAEVSYTDHSLGRLLDALGGRRDQTLVVVTADHGESLGENRYWFDHGETLSGACVRVPLLVAAPWRGGGRVVEGPVSHVDVLPTVLELLGVAPPEGIQGRSLAPSLASGRVEDRFVFFETFLPSSGRREPLFGLRSSEWKVTRSGSRARLFRYGAGAPEDPETVDLAAGEPERLRELRAVLDAYAAQEPVLPSAAIDPSPEQLEKLRALGYVR